MKKFNDWWNGVAKKVHGTKMFNPGQVHILKSLCEQAYKVGQEPSNQEVAGDTKPCDSIYHDKRRYQLGYDKFCRDCGKALSD